MRQVIKYNIQQLELIQIQKKKLNLYIEESEIKKELCFYDNQNIAANDLLECFKDKKNLHVLLTAETQSGKTGCLCEFIYRYINYDLIPTDNIYIITGLSSNDWIIQTKNRFPGLNNIYHLKNLYKFKNNIENKQNVLILIDEVHIASLKYQTLDNIFLELNFKDKKFMFENDIKIVETSATPDGIIYDLKEWNENSKNVFMKSGINYTSNIDLLKQKKVFQFKDLDNKDNIKELQLCINSYNKPMYHFIRLSSRKKEKQKIDIQDIFGINNYEYKEYYQTSNITLLNLKNDILFHKPTKHTIIFILEKLRCAISFDYKKYIGVLYDRYTSKINDSVIIQGFLGRLTGYNYNGESICFTNIDSIEKYQELLKTNFSKDIIWNSNTTKIIKNKTESKNTFYNISNNILKEELKIKFFKTEIEGRLFIKKITGNRGPNIRTKDKNGFYNTYLRNKHGIYTEKEIIQSNLQESFCNKCGYFWNPIYNKDSNNKPIIDSLQWMLHYK